VTYECSTDTTERERKHPGEQMALRHQADAMDLVPANLFAMAGVAVCEDQRQDD